MKKTELKKELYLMGIRVVGNYIKRKDLEKVLKIKGYDYSGKKEWIRFSKGDIELLRKVDPEKLKVKDRNLVELEIEKENKEGGWSVLEFTLAGKKLEAYLDTMYESGGAYQLSTKSRELLTTIGGLNKKSANKIIEKELKDLAVPLDSSAYKMIFETAIEAAEIMNVNELKKYIEEYASSIPDQYYY